MVEPNSTGDGNVTDIVVAAQAGLALVRVDEPINKPQDEERRLPQDPLLADDVGEPRHPRARFTN